MKKTILAVLIIGMVATPCFSQEIEVDRYLTLEGTLWLGLDMNEGESQLGFHGGDIYSVFKAPDNPERCIPCSKREPSICYYSNLPFVAMFYTENQDYMGTNKEWGLMLPHLSIGITFTPIFTSFLYIYPQIYIKVASNWVPPEKCFVD